MNRTFKTSKGTELPISVIRGQEYLEVKYRVQWFREEHPDWSIETEILSTTKDESLAKAVIKDPTGRTMATAHKKEDVKGFSDHMEKCETSAIGRALALLGYGTQFCGQEMSEGNRLADSPTGPANDIHANVAGNGTASNHAGPAAPHNYPGKFVISFGKKYQGMTIEQAIGRDGLPALSNYVQWLEDAATKQGKPVSGGARELIVNLERYIQSKSLLLAATGFQIDQPDLGFRPMLDEDGAWPKEWNQP